MSISSPGIGSNLDVNGIVTKLMTAESQPLTALNQKQASYQAKLSAYGSLSGALAAFQNALKSVSSPSAFQSVLSNSADATIATGTATNKAVAGNYNVNVTQLAQAQTITSSGQTSSTTTIGSGASTTISFEFGTISGGTLSNGRYATDNTVVPPNAPAFTQDSNQAGGIVTIDGSNNSLQGIRDAINKAGLGVTATIISDGSATPNHLVLTSTKTGATSSMKISVSGDSALSDLLAYDPSGTQNLTQNTVAQNTALTVNGIAITSASTTVSEAIQGVSLKINKIGSTSISIASDTTSVQSSVNTFVKAYNDLNNTIKNLTSYDSATQKAGLLIGDSTIQNIQSQVSKVLSSSLAGLGGSLTTLYQIGVSTQKDGTMSVDSSKLQNAITNNLGGVGALFASMSTTTDSLVSFISSTSATQPGSSTVNITAIATQGKTTGVAPAGLTIKVGDQLAMTVDGVSATVNLQAGTYASKALLAQIQSAINGTSAFSSASIGVTVSMDNSGILSINSNRYGAASNLTVAGSGANNLLGTSQSIGTPGVDVAGTINGISATGSGQTLTGAVGTSVEGLKLQINGGDLGDRGTAYVSQGYAYQLSTLVDTFLGSSSLISGQTDGINRSIKDIGKSRDALNLRLADIEKRYRAQFTALDVAIGTMTTTSNFLTQQLAQLSKSST